MRVNNDSTVLCLIKNIIAVLILSITISVSSLSGQQKDKDIPPLKDRLFFGGSFALQLGTITNIEVSPMIGLWVLPRLAVAVGPNYRYYKFENDNTNILGGKSYVQFVVFQDLDKYIPIGLHTNFFLHCEDEALSLQSDFWDNTSVTTKRFLINTVLAGAGLSQSVGPRSSINLIVEWALNDSKYNIYGNPEIKISFVF